MAALAGAVALAGCAGLPPSDAPSPQDTRATLQRLLPDPVAEKAGWAADIQTAFAALDLTADTAHLCAAIAVIGQESGFDADPRVPGLPKIAWAEIERRAERLGVPMFAVRAALGLEGPDGRTFAARIDGVRSERELSELFEDLIARVPLGTRLFADWNPVRTGGPMQVSIAFAQAHAERRPYPWPQAGSLRHQVFTRRGGLYFGIAHLLDYRADYDALRFRFADYNAGHHASRNAAFQNAVRIAGGPRLALDGDLIGAGDEPGATERAVRALAPRIERGEREIRRDLERGRDDDFADTTTWRRVFALADAAHGKPVPRAVMPQIDLASPKITRKLTTEWFATRVQTRHDACMARAAAARPAGT